MEIGLIELTEWVGNSRPRKNARYMVKYTTPTQQFAYISMEKAAHLFPPHSD